MGAMGWGEVGWVGSEDGVRIKWGKVVWESDCSNCLLSMSDIKIRSQKNYFKNGFKKRSWGPPLPARLKSRVKYAQHPAKHFFPDLQKSAPRNQFRTNVQMFIGTRIFKLDAIRLGFYFFFCKGQTLAAGFFFWIFKRPNPGRRRFLLSFKPPLPYLATATTSVT